MSLKIKTLSSKDLPVLKELFNYRDPNQMIAENKNNIERGIINIFALFCDDKLIGELRVKYHSQDSRFAQLGNRVYLYAFRIHEDYQGHGYGTSLLEHVLKTLQRDGYREFTIGVEANNPKSRYIYKKYGFTDTIARINETYQDESYEYDLLLRRTAPQQNNSSSKDTCTYIIHST